jgi:flavorubredoxin
MRTKQLTDDFFWVGSLDPDLRVFDIEVITEHGTSYNSFLLKCSEKNVLFEATGARFADEFIGHLSDIIPISDVDILVLCHNEPDHVGAVEKLLDINPDIEIYSTIGGINFIKEISNRDVKGVVVKDGEELDIGGKTIRFLITPNLHWPDTMFAYIPEEKALVTCDVFGNHLSYENIIYDDGINKEQYMKEALNYFDCLMSPFRKDVLYALDKIDGLEIDIIANGHGPVLVGNPQFIIDHYREWATVPAKAEKMVIIPYVSAYGFTRSLAENISEGIKAAGIADVRLFDMVYAEKSNVMDEIGAADGFLLGTPTMVGEALSPIWEIAISLSARLHGGKFAGAFGAYGWSGEGVPHIMQRLGQLKLKIVGEGFRVRFKPTEEDLARAFEYGKVFGEAVKTGVLPE